MSKPERAPFQPLTADFDEKLEQLASEKGVGSLVKPALSRPVTVAEKARTLTEESHEQSSRGATPRSRMKSVNMELPDYAWTELKIRSAHQQTSVRHIIMSALQKDGITINEIDMVEDGRRLRGREGSV